MSLVTDKTPLHITSFEKDGQVEFSAYITFPEASMLEDAEGYLTRTRIATTARFRELMEANAYVETEMRRFKQSGRELFNESVDAFLNHAIAEMYRFRLGSGMLSNNDKEHHSCYAIAVVQAVPVEHRIKLGMRLQLQYKYLEMGPATTKRSWLISTDLQF